MVWKVGRGQVDILYIAIKTLSLCSSLLSILRTCNDKHMGVILLIFPFKLFTELLKRGYFKSKIGSI